MNDNLDGDVLLCQTVDDGEIDNTGGFLTMTGGFETAAYTALFGGNDEDPGEDDTTFTWWGNIGEVDPAKRYRSKTQYLLHSIPAISGNLLRIEAAALADLQFLLDIKAANLVEVIASIPALNKIKLSIKIEANGIQSEFEFTENWEAMAS